MHSFVFTTLTSLVAATAASPLNKLQTRATCHDVHFITARGSYQPMPDNQDNELVPLVCDNYSGGSCGYEDVQYPANPSGGADYCPKSEIPGANAAMDQVNAYASACPGTKIVLAGYSQGAEVIGDVLAGGGGNGCQPGYEPLDPNGTASAMIAAVVIFGDPSRTPGQSYDVGSAGDGVTGDFTRGPNQINYLNNYADRMQSYCTTGDNVCTAGSGGTDGNAHGSEVETWKQDAANFILSKI